MSPMPPIPPPPGGIIGAFFWPDQFFRAYLFSYMFYIGLTLGCMALAMLQYLSGGAWGLVI